MEKVFISVEEGIKRLSDGLGKPVDHEALAQAFELAPNGGVPFPLFVRLRHALALGRRGFEILEDCAPWEDEENSLRQLICPWPSAERSSARSLPDPRFEECFVALDDHRGMSNRDGVRIRTHGYLVIVERQAHFIRSGWSLSLCVLPREVYAIDENAPPLMIESPSGEPQEWDCLFRAADIDAYLKTARGNAPLAGENSEDGSYGKAAKPTLEVERIDAPELEAAIAAYRAVRNNTDLMKRGTLQAIDKWLQENRKSLSTEARKRIATVANWNKVGGAPKASSGKA